MNYRPGWRHGRGHIVALGATAGLFVLVTGCAGQSSPTAVSQGGSPSAHRAAVGRQSSSGAKLVAAEGAAAASIATGGARIAPGSTGGAVPGPGSVTQQALSGVAGAAMFGGNRGLAAEQGKLNRTLAITRSYYGFGETFFPRRWEQRQMAAGGTLLISMDTNPPGPTYNSIAAGRQDAWIRGFLEGVDHAAVKYHLGAIYVSFEHEVNFQQKHKGLGTPAEFVQAWDHIHSLAASAHLNWQQGGRLHWVLILSHWTYDKSVSAFAGGPASLYWPGSNEVDVVAADGYDSFGCNMKQWTQPTTPASVFGGLVSWAHAHGNLPVFLAEWADSNAITSAQVTYVRQMQAFVTANHEIAAALYWNSPGIGCSYTLTSPALVALAAMGRSAALSAYVART
jgi:hypothetical protein